MIVLPEKGVGRALFSALGQFADSEGRDQLPSGPLGNWLEMTRNGILGNRSCLVAQRLPMLHRHLWCSGRIFAIWKLGDAGLGSDRSRKRPSRLALSCWHPSAGSLPSNRVPRIR